MTSFALRTCPVAIAALASLLGAQVESGGRPPSASQRLPAAPTVVVAAPDTTAITASGGAGGKSGVLRFGVEIPLALGRRDAGTVTPLAGGDRVWRLRLRSPGARSLGLMFARFRLAAGQRMFVYGNGSDLVRGAYTATNNKPDGLFAIQPTPGDALTLELYEPAATPPAELRLSHVVHDVLGVLQRAASWQAPQALSCEADVGCPPGAPWPRQIRAAIQVQVGATLCSAVLLNNTALDGRQLCISAEHCGKLDNAIFRFLYQRSGCNTGAAPANLTVQGSRELAADTGHDLRLVEITAAIPASYQPYYAGWDRSGQVPAHTFTVHHPQGGPKKISIDDDPPGKKGSAWHIYQWDLGVTEGGSSGGPLYDPAGRFIGQLTGGLAACGFPYDDYFIRLEAEWSTVARYLDPAGNGATVIDGLDPLGAAVPPAIGQLAPTAVTAFLPGPVTLTGAGLRNVTEVKVGRRRATFSVQSDSQLTFTPPIPAALGSASVEVGGPFGTSAPLTLSVLATAPPKHSAPASFAAGQSLPLAWGGEPGQAYVFGIALSGQTTPFNGFTALRSLQPIWQGTLDAIGYGPPGIAVPVPLYAIGTTFYSQVWTLDLGRGLGSFQASTVLPTAIQ